MKPFNDNNNNNNNNLKRSCELLKIDNELEFPQNVTTTLPPQRIIDEVNIPSNNEDLLRNTVKLTTISSEDIHRQSSVHSDQTTLHVTQYLHPTNALSQTASAFSSYLRIPPINEQMNESTISTTHSADWSTKPLHRSSCFICNTPQSFSEEEQKFTEATVRAVLAASARQSRTALTDLPLEFFTNYSNLSNIDSKLNSLSVQQLSNRNLSNENTFNNVNRLNLPSSSTASSSKFYDDFREHRTNRKLSALCVHSFDDTIHDSVLLVNKRDKSPIPRTILHHSNNHLLNSTNNLTHDTQSTHVTSTSSNKNTITTSSVKQNPKSLKNLARQTSHSINRPLKRLAASFRLTKPIGHSASVNYKQQQHQQQQHARSNFISKSGDITSTSWNSIENCHDSVQTTSNNIDNNNNNNNEINNGKTIRTRNVILQTDQDFLNEIKREKGLRKGHLLLNENNLTTTTTAATTTTSSDKHDLSDSTDHETDSLLSQDDKPSGSFHLKEQFFAFFQPTGNKLAMKLFGTKLALDRERLRQEQQGDWIIHPCSNFR
ncbi:unnamed protein product [Schistosoma turkestanicum]|nr:unnamed protein product [Schistosoma turkestanicum]